MVEGTAVVNGDAEVYGDAYDSGSILLSENYKR